jgi:PhnB protein
MASQLNPYLGFKDTARQAMEFYQSVFGGDLTINTFAEYGAADGPEGENVMHARLQTPSGFVLMASDAPPQMEVSAGSSITVSLSGTDADELRGYWEKLSDGGTVMMPLEKQMWGDDFGMCTDRFGTPWMVDIVPTQA